MDAKKHPPKRYENRVIRERPAAQNVGNSDDVNGFELVGSDRLLTSKNSGERCIMASTLPVVAAVKRSIPRLTIFSPRQGTTIRYAKRFLIASWATSSIPTPSSKLSSVISCSNYLPVFSTTAWNTRSGSLTGLSFELRFSANSPAHYASMKSILGIASCCWPATRFPTIRSPALWSQRMTRPIC